MSTGRAARNINADALIPALRDAHRHAWDLLADLSPSQWTVPYHAGINPPLWELAHMTWFTEWWTLRHPTDGIAKFASRLAGADALLDSAKIQHRARWNASIQPIDTIRAYCSDVLEDIKSKLASEVEPDLYAYRLALFHADMHGEALTYLRQTLDFPLLPVTREPAAQPADGFARCAGGDLQREAMTATEFLFDNEMPFPQTQVAPFSMARRCVTYGEYLVFVNDQGYQQRNLWSETGWQWKLAAQTDAPARWRRTTGLVGAWEERWFGAWRPLDVDLPVCHVNAHEAEAYCTWAGLRLPTEVEWQWAATHDEITWGNSVWEWTSDAFTPYPGFVAGPYREYSAPWFGNHRVLRGGSFATHPRMQHPRYRNFYLPERNDVFAGFRSCKI